MPLRIGLDVSSVGGRIVIITERLFD